MITHRSLSFTPLVQMRSAHTHTSHRNTHRHTLTLRHTFYVQGDFGCRATDGEATDLVQPALSRSDSRLGAAQHLGRPGAPDANLNPTHNTQPGTRAVNPAIGAVQPVE